MYPGFPLECTPDSCPGTESGCRTFSLFPIVPYAMFTLSPVCACPIPPDTRNPDRDNEHAIKDIPFLIALPPIVHSYLIATVERGRGNPLDNPWLLIKILIYVIIKKIIGGSEPQKGADPNQHVSLDVGRGQGNFGILRRPFEVPLHTQ